MVILLVFNILCFFVLQLAQLLGCEDIIEEEQDFVGRDLQKKLDELHTKKALMDQLMSQINVRNGEQHPNG